MSLSPRLLETAPPRRSAQGLGPRLLIVAGRLDADRRAYLADSVKALSRAGYRSTCLEADPEGGLWRGVRARLYESSFGLIHAHGLDAAAQACLGGLGMGVPLVVTLHEWLHPSGFTGLRGQVRRWLLGRVLARAAAVITLGEDSRANLLRFFPNLRRLRERTHTVRAGIASGPYEGKRRAKPQAAERRIGYFGPPGPDRGFDLLTRATARLMHYGGVAPFQIVTFDAVDGEETALGQLDLVVVPSLWETWPRVAMEALAAGVPVLGADAPGLREVLAGTPARTFPAGDLTALETALREALTHPWTDEARRFAPEARRRFDNRDSLRQLVELHDLVATGGSPVVCTKAGEPPALRQEGPEP
jgi:glycosyltransferase involved in cell wall biosynthesis